MGRALPVGIVWWIGKRTEGGFAGALDSEGRVDRSCRMLWLRSIGDKYQVLCVADVGGILRISEELDRKVIEEDELLRGEIEMGSTMVEPITTLGDWEQLAGEDVETMLDPGGTHGEHAHDLRMCVVQPMLVVEEDFNGRCVALGKLQLGN